VHEPILTPPSFPPPPNVKQVLTIVLAVAIFDVALNPTNVLGISLTLAGGACASLPLLPLLSLLSLLTRSRSPAPSGSPR